MLDRFGVSGALQGGEACLVGVVQGFALLVRCRIVVSQDFRLGGRCLGKPLFQHLGNLLVVVLPGTPQQRLIGCLLDQGMLEDR